MTFAAAGRTEEAARLLADALRRVPADQPQRRRMMERHLASFEKGTPYVRPPEWWREYMNADGTPEVSRRPVEAPKPGDGSA